MTPPPCHLSAARSPARLPCSAPGRPGRDAPLGRCSFPVRERVAFLLLLLLGTYSLPPPLLRAPRTARCGKQSGGRLHGAKLGLPQTGRGGRASAPSPLRIFAITFGPGDDFRAESSSSHWLGRQNNYDHILMLLAGAYCLLVVKDLLSIHQPPIFANYILLK